MKIINREQFLEMPSGTLFSKYEPCLFSEIEIKSDSCGDTSIDYYYQEINNAIDSESGGDFIDKLEDSRINGTSLKMDFDCESRDGLYEEDQLFAIWEKQDVVNLIVRLEKGLKDGYKNENNI